MESGLRTREINALCSFRDPDGFVFRDGDRILRCVFPQAAAKLLNFLSSEIARVWVAEGALCSSDVIPAPERTAISENVARRIPEHSLLIEHTPLRFPNYPYEWTPEMLRAAAEATLRMAREALTEGFCLKDATPYNLMFEGTRPVFIDVLSFERHRLDAIWPAYAQFVCTFVYPLIAAVDCGCEISELLLVHRDGIGPERIARMLGARRWLPRFFGSVGLPAVLSQENSRSSASRALARKSKDAREAEFVLQARFRKAQRLLPAIRSRNPAYMEKDCVYSSDEWNAKQAAVAEALRQFCPERVLDIGCNTGHFSRLACEAGATVVAIDRDSAATGALWSAAVRDGLSILPLVVDIARPTSGCGWANAEFPSFLDRARGQFDGVLMLALAHHLIVSERVPVDQIFELAASLTRRFLLIEYVDPSDPQFRRIARGRASLHRDLTPQSFEKAARVKFEIAGCRPVTPTRVIYTLERKSR